MFVNRFLWIFQVIFGHIKFRRYGSVDTDNGFYEDAQSLLGDRANIERDLGQSFDELKNKCSDS